MKAKDWILIVGIVVIVSVISSILTLSFSKKITGRAGEALDRPISTGNYLFAPNNISIIGTTPKLILKTISGDEGQETHLGSIIFKDVNNNVVLEINADKINADSILSVPASGNAYLCVGGNGVVYRSLAPCTGKQCIPNCVGKECGDDGCGGSCGTCPASSACVLGRCAASTSFHCADINRDLVINGTEFNRVAAYWRAGGYHVEPEGMDGYAPGYGSHDGVPHCADLNRDWVIDFNEYNKVLELWRAGRYVRNPDGSFSPFGIQLRNVAAYYPLDNNTWDYSGNKNHIQPGRDSSRWAVLTDGVLNKGYEFDGENDCAYIPRANNLRYLTKSSFSFSVWAKPEGLSTDPSVYWKTIFTTTYSGYPNRPYSTGIHLDSDGRPLVTLVTSDGKTLMINSSQSISLDRWHNFVLSVDDSLKKVYLYVDGNLVGEGSYAGKILGDYMATPTPGYYYVGCYDFFNRKYDKANFKGVIDEIKIYNRALTSVEIAQEYSTLRFANA